MRLSIGKKLGLAMLQQFGCDALQGYLFAKPQPVADMVALLKANKGCFGLDGH